ncbi:MAG: glycosyltransferase family 4 protein [Nanoarchaeota archaeon]
MRILEVIYRFPPAIAGSGKVAYELSKEFVKKGHDVTVVTSTSLDNNDVRGLSTGRGFSLKSNTYKKRKEMMDGIKVIRFEPLFQFWTFGLNPSMKKYLKENIHKFDIVHVHGYQAYEAYIVSEICMKHKRPFVLTAHDIISHYPGFFAIVKKTYDLVMGKKILNNSSGLIALTQENVEQYNDILDCNDKISIIPNGINDYKKTSKNRKLLEKMGNPKRVILFLGRIVEYKGCQYIIDALPEILERYPNTVAAFVGIDGGYTGKLKQRADNLDVGKRCFFSGAVDDIEPYINLADVFVFPSRGEGFGIAPVEAMSVGVPAILADMGGLRYVLKDIGGLSIDMEKNVPEQISKNVLDIFEGKLHKNLAKDGEKNAREYKWSKIASKTLEFLNSSILRK